MGIDDKIQAIQIGPLLRIRILKTSVDALIRENLFIFNHPLIRDVGKKIGTKVDNNISYVNLEKCKGEISSSRSIKNANYRQIEGWIEQNDNEQIHIVNNSGKITGHILVTKHKVDFIKYPNGRPNHVFFKGYILKEESNFNMLQMNCSMKIEDK